MGLLQLGKDVSVESLTSGNSSGNGDDQYSSNEHTSELINDLQLSLKLNEICALEEKLREKEQDIFDLQKKLQNYEQDREKNLLMVIEKFLVFFLVKFFVIVKVICCIILWWI
jgi:hypothetical protein